MKYQSGKKIKILHLLQSPHFSGAENVVCQIISMFTTDDSVEMIYCSQDGPIREALIERNITFYPLDEFSVGRVKNAIKTLKPDIIHAHDMRASLYAAIACKNIPLISHIHNNAFDSRGFSFKSVAFLYAAIKAKRIFWVSQSAYNGYFFRDLFKGKSEILYNIIDVQNIYDRMKQDENTYTYDVVFIGRLSEPKNPLRIVDVVKLASENYPKLKVAIIGTGELESKLIESIRSNNLENVITMLGYKSNPLKILYDAKLMIMTSLWEGTPMCALEAMALGVPIVSTPVDGLKDLIENGVNGYLSEDNKILADKIVEFISNPETLQIMSGNQITRSEEWNNQTRYKSILLNSYNIQPFVCEE